MNIDQKYLTQRAGRPNFLLHQISLILRISSCAAMVLRCYDVDLLVFLR